MSRFKHKGGRPTKMTPATLRKLETVYAYGGNEREACLYAGIGQSTLYDYQRKHPEFSERKSGLQTTPVLAARRTIYDALSTDTKIAMWFLERKRPEEFAPARSYKGKVDVKVGTWQDFMRRAAKSADSTSDK